MSRPAGDEGAAPVAAHHVPGLHQAPHSLAHRRPADAVVARQLGLVGQLLTGSRPAIEQLLEQRLPQLVDERRAAGHGSQLPLVGVGATGDGQHPANLGGDIRTAREPALEDGAADGEAPGAGRGEGSDLLRRGHRPRRDHRSARRANHGPRQRHRVLRPVAVGEQVEAMYPGNGGECMGVRQRSRRWFRAARWGGRRCVPGMGSSEVRSPPGRPTPSSACVPPSTQSTPISGAARRLRSSSSRDVETTSSMTSMPSSWAARVISPSSATVAPTSLKPT